MLTNQPIQAPWKLSHVDDWELHQAAHLVGTSTATFPTLGLRRKVGSDACSLSRYIVEVEFWFQERLSHLYYSIKVSSEPGLDCWQGA